MIEGGIKQPMRIYDSLEKQNYQRPWVNDSGFEKEQLLINPNNTIIPFQVRRATSLNPVAVFDLYKHNPASDSFEYSVDLLDILPASDTDHMRVLQIGATDAIIWNPQKSFTETIECGIYYFHLSDGVNNWYSEVFRIFNFSSETVVLLDVSPHIPGITREDTIGWTVGGIDYHLAIKNP